MDRAEVSSAKNIWFDPALREIFLRNTGKSWHELAEHELPTHEIPVVAKLRDPERPVAGLHIVCRFRTVVTGRVPLNRVVQVRQDPNVISLKASNEYSAELAVSVPEMRADRTSLEAVTPDGVSGLGVVIGIADWGADFAHPNFRRPDGSTRILYLWDQRDSQGPSPMPFGYGREIRSAEINRALRSADPYASLGYDPIEVDRGLAGTHGTHVMDIAGGNGAAPGAAPGVAPDADFIFVHLRGNDTDPRDTLGDSVRLLEAMRYIHDRAGERPVVINTSLGRTGGPKDGTTLGEQGLDELLSEAPGCAAVMSTGNYRVSAQHASGQLSTGEQIDLAWRVLARHNETAEMEIWYTGADRFSVEVIDPYGNPILRAARGEEAVYRESGEILGSIYHRQNDPTNGDNQIDIFLWPAAPIGTWTVRLAAEEAATGQYHAYIERDDPGYQSRFLHEFAERRGTTNTICNGRLTIAVGAYDARAAGDPAVEFSSEGPTRDGRLKPDCAAPGAGIRAARSSYWNGQERAQGALTIKSGTSMAAPHVTGTVALMFEAAEPLRMPIEVTRDLLFRACRLPADDSAENRFRFGAGMVDAAAAVALTLEWKAAVTSGSARSSAVEAFVNEGEDYSMPLLDAVKKICTRLAPGGWSDLLLKHGLDIRAADLAKELAKPLAKIDRTIPGFEDFALEGTRGVEPGHPARSLLYHTFASGGVTTGAGGSALSAFPTWAELNTLENYIFAVKGASFEDLKKEYGSDLAIAAFAVEHRGLQRTVHRKHADLCFARAGVARIGTEEARYLPELRGFTPISKTSPHSVCVVPARYSVYLAVRKKGTADVAPKHSRSGDDGRSFWIPVHKLFAGKECLKGLDLKVDMRMCHYNEKLKRLRVALGQTSGVDLDKPPFVLSSGLADWGDVKQFGPGVVMPVKHSALVAYAKTAAGKVATFKVDRAKLPGRLWASLSAPTRRDGSNWLLRSAPEWIHARYTLKNGAVVDQSDRKDKDIEEIIETGGYEAVHVVDFTGEGWIAPTVKPLPAPGMKVLSAYSLVSAPDFFPFCDQLQLTEWADGLTGGLKIWEVEPRPLSDNRLPLNLQVPGSPFEASDVTGTAVVSLFYSKAPAKAKATARRRSSSWLPDAAAGVHAPGWDVSLDATAGTTHYAQYGLGSPFPEDAQLCAALSAFWPAVAPDIARKFEPGRKYSVAPLTDDELGQGSGAGFDGYKGPTMATVSGKKFVDFPRASYTDYVRSALEGKFNFEVTAKIGFTEYRNRVLAMALAYAKVGAATAEDKRKWTVFSFRRVATSDAELQRSQRSSGVTLADPVYRIQMVQGKVKAPAAAEKTVRMEVTAERIVFVNPTASGQIFSMAA